MFAVTPETHFFDHFYAQSSGSFKTKAEGVDAVLADPRMLDLGVDRDAILQAFEAFQCDPAGLLCAVLEAYRCKRDKAHVIEKTPAHLPYVPMIFEWFPNARVLYIERDGRDAVMSLMRMPWSHKNLRRHARMWRWCVTRAETFQQRFGDRFYTVQYEALVRQPERELDRICSFLGVDREDAQLDPSIPTDVVPEWEQVWKQGAANEPVHTGRIQEWRATGSHAELLVLNSMMGATLRARNYPDTRLPQTNPLKRIVNALQNGWYLMAYHPRIRPALAALRRAIQPLLGNAGSDVPEVVGEDACAEWHREHNTRERIGA